MKIIEELKELVGINSVVEEYDENEEMEEFEEEFEEEKKPAKKSLFSRKTEENIKKEYTEENTEDESDYSTVFIDPKQFEDCKKIAKYINLEKMITINLENVSPNIAQRIMDFLAGAMEIKNANFSRIAKNVYTIVPENMKVYYEEPKKKEKKIIDLERGEN